MSHKTYGYVRVSSKDQNEARQIAAMEEYGLAKCRLYVDKQSGKDFDRPGYKRMIARLRPGDTVVVKSIDRLGRNYEEILHQWRFITKEKQANIFVLDMPLLDTRQKDQDLTGTFIADLVLQILSYVSQIERENIRQRQAEGIAAARARGVHFGRREMPIPEAFYRLDAQYEKGIISSRKAGQQLGVSHSTFLKWHWERKDSVGEHSG